MKPMMTSELRILKSVYPVRGSRGVRELLPHRSANTINVQAFRLGLKVQPGARRQFTDDVVRSALEAASWNTRAAAAALGCSGQTVWLAYRRMRQALVENARLRNQEIAR